MILLLRVTAQVVEREDSKRRLGRETAVTVGRGAPPLLAGGSGRHRSTAIRAPAGEMSSLALLAQVLETRDRAVPSDSSGAPLSRDADPARRRHPLEPGRDVDAVAVDVVAVDDHVAEVDAEAKLDALILGFQVLRIVSDAPLDLDRAPLPHRPRSANSHQGRRRP